MTSEAIVDEELLAEFLDESIQSLRSLPETFARYCASPSDSEAINAVFRAVHSLKGSAGFFGLVEVKKFAHALENTLDRLRQGAIRPTPELRQAVTTGLDHLEQWISGDPRAEADAETRSTRERILEQVDKSAAEPEDAILAELDALIFEVSAATGAHTEDWVARLSSLRQKLDPDTELEAVSASAPQTKRAAEFAQSQFSFEQEDISSLIGPLLPLFIETDAGRYSVDLRDGFLQASDDAMTWAEMREQVAFRDALQHARGQFKTIVNSPLDVDSHLLSIVWETICPAISGFLTAATSIESEKANEAASADASPKEDPAKKANAAHFIRIREDRLEEFMNSVSRLFITSERVKDYQRRSAPALTQPALVDEIREISAAFNVQVNDLQKSVIALRKVPIHALFSKFPRVARTLAESLGKKLRVNLIGDQLEIDKTLIDSLEAPLTHMVRNVCDHGIETPAERLQRGVPAEGTLTLECELSRTHVTIRIRDDGRGINPAILRAKAIEKGIYPAAEANRLSDAQAIDLIFHAGFSTADKVSDVSGRGVGMDVVRTNVMAHGGSVRVESVVNQGTTFTLQIPNRQAVMVVEGILLEEGFGRFVAPFEHVSEIIELDSARLSTVQGRQVAVVRETPIAAIRLSSLLGMPNSNVALSEPTGIILHHKQRFLCLIVERVVGQRKVVVNPIASLLPSALQIGGVAQLGGNELALVLNVPEILDAQSRPPAQS